MEIQGNYYRCNKCSRITQSYPLGCRERDCPVKNDFMNDAIYGSFIYLILLCMVLLGLFYIVKHNVDKDDLYKDIDKSIERRYNK